MRIITVSFIISTTIDIDLMYSWFKVQLMLPKAWILIYPPLKVKWHFLKAWHSQVCNAIPKKSFHDLSCLKVEQLYLNPRIQRALSRRMDLVMKETSLQRLNRVFSRKCTINQFCALTFFRPCVLAFHVQFFYSLLCNCGIFASGHTRLFAACGTRQNKDINPLYFEER